MTEKLDGLTMDLESANKDKLRSVFPECFTEGRLDIDKLLSLCGEYITDDFEKYEFKWKGKSDCLRLAQKRSTATLRPVPGDSMNWDTTQNLYIEGDNLEVLKLLQKSYFRKVKMIYIDPPYNTGNDFVYEDDFADPLARYKEVTAQTTKSNPETMGRYHTNWLNMMYPRLRLAANLLRDDGVIFISIDDCEISNLRRLCDEVFGEENFVDTIIWKKRYGGGAKEKFLVSLHEYALMYCKSLESLGELFIPLTRENKNRYYQKKDEHFATRGGYRTHPLEATKSMDSRENLVYPIPAPDGTTIMPKRQWLWSKERAYTALENNELEVYRGSDGEWQVATKQYLCDENGIERGGKMFSIIEDIYTQHGTNEMISLLGNAKIFPFPKPVNLLKQLIQGGMPSTETEWEYATKNILDIGFKVFRLDSSNLKLWDDTPIDSDDLDNLFARMDGIIDNLKPDRSEDDLVYEILLKMGYPLTADVATMEMDELIVYTVERGGMLICLQPGVTVEIVEKLAALGPQKIVLAENALADNSAMSNAHYLLGNRGIELKIV